MGMEQRGNIHMRSWSITAVTDYENTVKIIGLYPGQIDGNESGAMVTIVLEGK